MTTGITALVNMKPITSLNVIQFPSGVYGYVGHVPIEIGFIDPTPEKIEAGKQCGARFGPKTRHFDSYDAAVEYAESQGYEVTPPKVS